VIFVYPATSGSKPSEVYPAEYTDWTAIGIPIGTTTSEQIESLDTNTGSPIFVNPTTGKPGISDTRIVAVGGPLVHSVVYWLEKDSTGSISTVYSQYWGTVQRFRLRSTGQIVAEQAVSTPVTSQDYFVIYTISDAAGNVYYVFYGFRHTGSMAATHLLLSWAQNAQLASQTSTYQVWLWQDTNGDCLVSEVGIDTYTLITSG
jgi:hypothetical protein